MSDDTAKARMRVAAGGLDLSGASASVAANLAAWPPIHGVVASYLAMATEIDLTLIHDLDRCRVCVPRIEPDRSMTLREYDPSKVERHRFGFLQPVADAPQIAESDVDVVLVPGLAFDRSGGRLGRGGGFYDRLLATLPEATARIGVTAESAVVPSVPREPHDMPIAWLATNAGVSWVGDRVEDPTQAVMAAAIERGVAPQMRLFPEGTRTSKDAARAVDCPLGAIAKSIVFRVGDRFVLALCPGDRRVDERSLAAHFSEREARPATRCDVQAVTGFVAGGTPAFGHATPLEVVADAGLARYRWVWSAGGTPDTVYPVSLERLIAASGARWAEIATQES